MKRFISLLLVYTMLMGVLWYTPQTALSVEYDVTSEFDKTPLEMIAESEEKSAQPRVEILTTDEGTIYSGTCGENVAWVLDEEGVITISGTGPMDDYDHTTHAPWYDYRSSIKTVIIEEGVTRIGNMAFQYCVNITTVKIAEGLTSIGVIAFTSYKISSLSVPNSITEVDTFAFSLSSNSSGWTRYDNAYYIGNEENPYVVLLKSADRYAATCTVHPNTKVIAASAFSDNNTEEFQLSEVVFPDGLTHIGAYAFADCKRLTEITLGGNVTSVGDGAFSDCQNLVSVTLGASVVSIGDYAFENCKSLTDLSIPDSLRHVGQGAFEKTASLAYNEFDGAQYLGNPQNPYVLLVQGPRDSSFCEIHEDTVLIGKYAFSKCSAMCDIVIPASVCVIDNMAFSRCNSAQNIYFRGEMPAIAEDAFENVFSYAYFPENNATWTADVKQNYGGQLTWRSMADDGHVYFAVETPATCIQEGYTTFTCVDCDYYYVDYIMEMLPHEFDVLTLRCKDCGYSIVAGKNLTWSISEDGTVLTISGTGDMYDFSAQLVTPWSSYRYQITTVIIEEGVTSIGDNAFYLPYVTSVTIPRTVTRIGESAFTECAFCEIHLPDSLVTIDAEAFDKCYRLTKLEIPDNVTTIGKSAFRGCVSLAEIYLGKSAATIDPFAFEGCYGLTKFGASDENPRYCVDEYGVLYNKEQTEIVRAPHMLSGDYVLANTVTRVCDQAFEGCVSLSGVQIPQGVTDIGAYAFANCISLCSMAVPQGVTDIGEKAFVNCDQLDGIWVDENNPNYFSDANGVLFDKAQTVLIQAPGLLSGDYTVPEGVKTIEDNAFYGCDSLTGILIPNTVVTVSRNAFMNCRQLFYVTLGNGVHSVEPGAFYGCDSLWHVLFTGTENQWKSISIYASNEILKEAIRHYDCAGNEMVGGVCSICGVISGTCGDNLTWELGGYGVLRIFGTGPMWDNQERGNSPWKDYAEIITAVEIGDGVTRINHCAFENCTALTTVTIPASVTDLGAYAFAGCTDLERITFEGNLAESWEGVFEGCTKLKSVYVHSPHMAQEWDYMMWAWTGITENATQFYFLDSLGTVNADFALYYSCDMEPEKVDVDGCTYWMYTSETHIVEQTEKVDSTCTEIGYIVYTCQNCGCNTVEMIPQKVHTYNLDGECVNCDDLIEYLVDVGLTLEDLILGHDGTYYSEKGYPVVIAVDVSLYHFGYGTLKSMVEYMGDRYVTLNCWQQLQAATNKDGYAYLTEETLAWLLELISCWNEDEASLHYYLGLYFPQNVHIYENGQIILAPTETAEGILLVSCSTCSRQMQVSMPCLNTEDYEYEVIRQQEGGTPGLARYTWKNTTYGVFSIEVELPFCMHESNAVWTAPTCTEDGYYTYTCQKCGLVEVEISPNTALGHDWQEATCTSAATCITCGATDGEPLEHMVEIIPGTSATCTEPGLTEGQKCAVCGEIIATQEEIPALGHDYMDGVCIRCGRPDIILGDVNGDGRINVRDARAILRYIAGLIGKDELNVNAADFNGDGRVNVRDARAILNYIAGMG